jgi:hypothetical protein
VMTSAADINLGLLASKRDSLPNEGERCASSR